LIFLGSYSPTADISGDVSGDVSTFSLSRQLSLWQLWTCILPILDHRVEVDDHEDTLAQLALLTSGISREPSMEPSAAESDRLRKSLSHISNSKTGKKRTLLAVEDNLNGRISPGPLSASPSVTALNQKRGNYNLVQAMQRQKSSENLRNFEVRKVESPPAMSLAQRVSNSISSIPRGSEPNLAQPMFELSSLNPAHSASISNLNTIEATTGPSKAVESSLVTAPDTVAIPESKASEVASAQPAVPSVTSDASPSVPQTANNESSL
jgi:hypothetical protein